MSKPNILIFMTDHQRGDTALSEHPAITPNLDALAADGVTFTNTYCPTPHCCPSRATFFTGHYPSRHGVWNNICNAPALSRGLAEGIRLWSEDLAGAGYELHWSGKWHVSLADTPATRGGWQEHYLTGDRTYSADEWEPYRKTAQSPYDTEAGGGKILRDGYGTYTMYGTRERGPGDHDEHATATAEKVLGDLGRDGGDKPWCMYVGLTGPHDPYFVPKEFLDLYDIDDVPLPPSFADDLLDKPRLDQRMRKQLWGKLSELEIREGIRHFWAFCSYLDSLFGRVMAALEATGQAENTLVLYTSDHGDYCGDHGLFAKGIPAFRGAYHVPAVIRWPDGLTRPGRRVDELVSLADFAPTFTDLAGLGVADGLAGASLAPFLRDQTPADWRQDIHTQCNGTELYVTQRSVSTKRHKYVFNAYDFDELYDLRADPHEMTNLADDDAYADIKRDMVRRMWHFARDHGDMITSNYITVGLAPLGPAEAFKDD